MSNGIYIVRKLSPVYFFDTMAKLLKGEEVLIHGLKFMANNLPVTLWSTFTIIGPNHEWTIDKASFEQCTEALEDEEARNAQIKT